jgi:phosphate transport system protein
MTPHYEERMEKDLGEIREALTSIGGMLDRAIANSVKALLTRDVPLASMTVLRDMPVNRASRDLDRLCHRFVARHLPSAGILRFISGVLRVSIGLERIGDYAVAVAREAIQHRAALDERTVGELESMASQARGMLGRSLDAFVKLDVPLARETMALEDRADALFRSVYHELIAEAERDGAPVRDLFGLLDTFHRLERVTDQSKNICEETLFAAVGEVKAPKVYRILFIDDRNAGASVMAQAIAKKSFPESGRYASAGWDPIAALDPGFVAFMDRFGHDIRNIAPAKIDGSREALRQYHVVVALAPGADTHVVERPYTTVLLDWSAEVAAAGPIGAFEDSHREALYKFLAPKIRELMELLRGDQAS